LAPLRYWYRVLEDLLNQAKELYPDPDNSATVFSGANNNDDPKLPFPIRHADLVQTPGAGLTSREGSVIVRVAVRNKSVSAIGSL
jgi:hypothetical protein